MRTDFRAGSPATFRCWSYDKLRGCSAIGAASLGVCWRMFRNRGNITVAEQDKILDRVSYRKVVACRKEAVQGIIA